MDELERPSPARIYDYLLGGATNTEADRAVAEQVLASLPWVRDAVWDNRAFLQRAVTYFVERGFDQFLDLGSGVPTVGNVHEIARALNPHARVVYVDIDPVAVAYATRLLDRAPEGTVGVHVLRADATRAGDVLDAVRAEEWLDLDRPVALLAVAILHFIDGPAAGLLADYRAALAPGSMIAITHYRMRPQDDPAARQAAADAYSRSSAQGVNRSDEQIAQLFTGLELAEPGVVPVSAWRPAPDTEPGDPNECGVLGGVGQLLERKVTPSA